MRGLLYLHEFTFLYIQAVLSCFDPTAGYCSNSYRNRVYFPIHPGCPFCFDPIASYCPNSYRNRVLVYKKEAVTMGWGYALEMIMLVRFLEFL